MEIVYPQLYNFRQKLKHAIRLGDLSREQLGLAHIDPARAHHIHPVVQPMQVGYGTDYRVVVCSECIGSGIDMDLGYYADFESAILINDVHEIMNGRLHKLLVLRPEDMPFLYTLTANLALSASMKRDSLVPTSVNIMQHLNEHIFTQQQPSKESSKSDIFYNNLFMGTSTSSSTTTTLQQNKNQETDHITILSELCSLPSPLRPRASSFAAVSSPYNKLFLVPKDETRNNLLSENSSSKNTSNIPVESHQRQQPWYSSGPATSATVTSNSSLGDASDSMGVKVASSNHPKDNTINNVRDSSPANANSLFATLSMFASMQDDEFAAAQYLTEMGEGKQNGEMKNRVTPGRSTAGERSLSVSEAQNLTKTHLF